MAEQATHNRLVTGSSPTRPTKQLTGNSPFLRIKRRHRAGCVLSGFAAQDPQIRSLLTWRDVELASFSFYLRVSLSANKLTYIYGAGTVAKKEASNECRRLHLKARVQLLDH